MRFATFAVVAGLGAGALAQGVPNLPKCAAACVGSNFGDCKTIDIKCICGRKEWISELSCCVSKSCNQQDTDTTIKFANDLCVPAGVTDLPKSASCPSTTAAAGSAPTPAASGSSSMDMGGSHSMGMSMGSSASGNSASAASATSSARSSGSSAASAAASAATGAAAHQEVGVGLAAVAGLLMAL